MHRTMEEVNRLCDMKKTLTEWVEAEIAKGKESPEYCYQEVGATIDMIKDLADAEKNMMKMKYYEMLICGMMTGDEDMYELGRMGYDHWHYANGKFAPKGQGHRVAAPAGFMPWPYDMDPEHMMDKPWKNLIPTGGPMGYHDGSRDWKDMDEKTRKEHIAQASIGIVEDIEEMWDDADPETRKRLEANLATVLENWKKKR